MIESRTLPLIFTDDNKVIALGGNAKNILAEEYDYNNSLWVPMDMQVDDAENVIQSGMRGFTVTVKSVLVSSELT